MTESIGVSDHGIVVDHREVRRRYAISDRNFNPKKHKYVRDLRAGETVAGYRPHPITKLGEKEQKPAPVDNTTNAKNLNLEDDSEETEGSSTEGDLGTDK